MHQKKFIENKEDLDAPHSNACNHHEMICSKGITCKPKHNCCFSPTHEFFSKIIWVKRKLLKPISPTNRGGPPFPFLVLQQPMHISIAKNCKSFKLQKEWQICLCSSLIT